jgi:hypothetical protein
MRQGRWWEQRARAGRKAGFAAGTRARHLELALAVDGESAALAMQVRQGGPPSVAYGREVRTLPDRCVPLRIRVRPGSRLRFLPQTS